MNPNLREIVSLQQTNGKPINNRLNFEETIMTLFLAIIFNMTGEHYISFILFHHPKMLIY